MIRYGWTPKQRVWATAILTAAVAVAATHALGCSGDSSVTILDAGPGGPAPFPDSGPRDAGADTDTPDARPADDASVAETVATPEFNPAEGDFAAPQNVAITSATAGATIHYTLDGKTPSASSPIYASPLSVATTTTLKAIALKRDSKDSAIRTGAYTITIPPRTVEPVLFTPNAGKYANDVTVSLESATLSATICYTLDTSSPACTAQATCSRGSLVYHRESSVQITRTDQRITAIACKSGMLASATTSADYSLTAAAPILHPEPVPGKDPSEPVLLVTATSRGIIHYTLDGSNPNCTSGATIHEGGTIPGGVFTSDTTVKAMTCKEHYTPSAVVEATYLVAPKAPTLTPGGGTFESAQIVNLTVPAGATICRTAGENPPDPSCNGAACTGSTEPRVEVSTTNTTIKAIACKAGTAASPLVSATYKLQPGAPTFDPPGGTVVTTETLGVRLSSSGASDVAYTTDGSAPSCSGTTVSNGGKINVAGNTTVKAIGCKANFEPSLTAQANYPKANVTDAPLPAPFGGHYERDQEIIIHGFDANRVCYTINGPDPDCTPAACSRGETYAGPFILGKNATIKAVACKEGSLESAITSVTYEFQVARVGIVMPDEYEVGTPFRYISETAADGGVTYHAEYGPNPETPTCASPVSPTALGVTEPGTLKVVGCKEGYAPSVVASQAYVPRVASATFSPPAGTYSDVQSVTIDSVTRSTAGLPTTLCYTTGQAAPSCDPSTLECSGFEPVRGEAPLTLQIKKDTKVRVVACAPHPHLAASYESSAAYTLKMGDITFSPHPSSGPFTAAIPKIDIAVENAPSASRICWSDTQSIPGDDCLAASAPPGVHCVDDASVSLDNGGAGFSADVVLNAVACKPSEPGLIPSLGGATYDFALPTR
ncbi:chitobiase/beta-hexosaminidase C-terminal domain-containing protein [Pendulispora rubella]|uniref:Chitobiase/beta-hexosaminidase C-terminal domain-containing protein n=1 Tax=Pendulispora rubella TaxID=2741070 RepID=A0ABZ2L2X7_9BACT